MLLLIQHILHLFGGTKAKNQFIASIFYLLTLTVHRWHTNNTNKK